MFRPAQRLLRLDRLERRLFGWLLLLTIVPMFALLATGYAITARSLDWVGTLGPWDSVAESGRVLIDAAQPAVASDPTLAAAVENHRRELSSSVLLARRWRFLGERMAAALPWFAVGLAVILTALALWVGRRLAVQLARPIKELAGWAELLPAGEPLPIPRPDEENEVREVRLLRDAIRVASIRIGEARDRALETERVRAWGEMARRIAHEMKNPLTPLRLAAHRLEKHPDAATELRESLDVINEETGRLEELARQFAVLGRPSTGPASEVDLRDLIERLLSSDVPPSIETKLTVAPNVPHIIAHYDALQRAFRNLIRNAVEAMDDPAVSQRQLTVRITRRRDAVQISIADTGRGIPQDRLERIFEPDFTLKAGGTGLGLAVVRQAVAAHAGRVRARSHETGAEFTVDLPLAPPAAATPEPTSETAASASQPVARSAG